LFTKTATRTFSIVNVEERNFSSKKKKGAKKAKIPGEVSDAEITGAEVEEDVFSAARQAGEAVKVAPVLFQEWSVGDVKKIQSAPGNQPPSKEDTIPGRYATVLFTTASQEASLYEVYEDFKYLSELYANSESFQMFTLNAGVGMKEIRLFNAGL